MSTHNSIIGALLGDPDIQSVCMGVVMIASGIINHAIGIETIGLFIVVCGVLVMMPGVAGKTAREAVK